MTTAEMAKELLSAKRLYAWQRTFLVKYLAALEAERDPGRNAALFIRRMYNAKVTKVT